MRRIFLSVILLGMLTLLLFAGTLSDSANAEASSVIKMCPGQSKTLKLPKGWNSVQWSSSRETVVKISKKGVAKAKSPGKAVITARSGKKIKKYRVEVQKMQVDDRKITIKVGDQIFSAILYDNDTARALTEKLPLTITMNELNGNEKYYYFSESLPTDAKKTEQIRTGDIMLYGSDCLVLFYEDFSTSYSYTPVGHISNSDGLAKALGDANVRVSFCEEEKSPLK